MAFGDADRDVFLETAVHGVAVVFGATTTTGIYDEQTVEVLDGQVMGQLAIEKSVRVKTGAFTPTLSSSITVNSVAYTIRDFRELPPDGRFTRIALKG